MCYLGPRGGRKQVSRYKIFLPSVLSGVLLVFAFPKFDLYPLAWVCLVPFLISLRGLSSGDAFRAGMLMGIPYFFGTQYWIYHSVHYYGGIPLIISFAIVLLLGLYLSLFTGLFGVLFSLEVKNTRLPAMLLAPLIWVSLEFARSYALTGFPWSSVGYSQHKFLHLIQISDLTGVYGVSFLVVAVNGALADISILRAREREMPLFSPSPTIFGYVLLGMTLAFSFGYGFYRLTEVRDGRAVKVSVVQGNIEQDVKWDPSYQSFVMDTHMRLTNSASAHKPALVVWPEASVPFYWERDELLTERIISFSNGLDSYFLFGAVTVKAQDGKTLLANSAVLLDKTGSTSYVYDKVHLVPFGEYVPLRRVFFFLDKLVTGIGDYVPGEKTLRAETPFGSFGTVICYEIIFPGLVRKFFSKGGDFMVTITNDAWFGKTAGPYQHWSMAVFRAIENRKPLIRAANTGISGFMDSNGAIISKTRLFERRALTETIRTDSARSFYSKFGDLFSYVVVVLTILILMDLKRQ